MEPLRLFIQNFQCHEESFIDFTKFQSALIIGKVDNNEERSNGVGKTTIFKALEYVLFNQSEVNLEKIIREDCDFCNVIFDFSIDNVEYRVARKRTKKSTDLSLFVRNNTNNSDVMPNITEYKDFSSRRAADTEKDLYKLTKFTYKSFRNIVHFPQDIKDGLSATTPEKRKTILKDVLDIINYSKLEKIAKDKYNVLSKDIDKYKILLDNLQDPFSKLEKSNLELDFIKKEITSKKNSILYNTLLDESTSNDLKNTSDEIAELEKQCQDVLLKEKNLNQDKSKLEISVSDYTVKKNILVKEAKSLVLELDSLKKEQKTLLDVDFSEYDQLVNDITACNDKIQDLKNKIKVNNINIENLLVPMPSDNKCKHCRQDLSPEHKKTCQENIDKELFLNKKENSEFEDLILKLKEDLLEKDKKLNLLNLYKKKINDINLKISLHNKEIASKKLVHDEYLELLNKYSKNLESTNLELSDILSKKNTLPLLKIKELKENIISLKEKQSFVKKDLLSLNNDLNSLNIKLGMLEYSLVEINKNCDLHKEYTVKLQELIKQARLYPTIIQAFSSSGIPNIIIQNVLDDLQVESNNLLNNLRPGLQLAFAVEKTKADGSEADTLDINYTLNGKERYYEQLSGAMKLAVSFSLKLGLSFVLQKLIGVNVRFFLLDEVDQSLDRATIDAFADMIKMFQNNFKFIIITHNDKLKDKFQNGIVVEQNLNMVSKAKFVNGW